MKITDPEVIKSGEKDLIDAVKEDLDLEVVRDILRERMTAAPLASSGGEIVVHDNQVAFRLDFKINLSGSLLFDRQGNFIEGVTGQEPDKQGTDEQEPDHQEAAMDDESDSQPLTGMELDEDLESDGDLDDASSYQDLKEDQVDDFDIDLPEYDQEGQVEDETPMAEPETRDFQIEDEEDDILVTDSLNDTPDAEEADLETTELDEPSQEDELPDLADINLQDIEGQAPEDNPEPDDQNLNGTDSDKDSMEDQPEEDALDDDINDILKESQDFWEKKEE